MVLTDTFLNIRLPFFSVAQHLLKCQKIHVWRQCDNADNHGTCAKCRLKLMCVFELNLHLIAFMTLNSHVLLYHRVHCKIFVVFG